MPRQIEIMLEGHTRYVAITGDLRAEEIDPAHKWRYVGGVLEVEYPGSRWREAGDQSQTLAEAKALYGSVTFRLRPYDDAESATQQRRHDRLVASGHLQAEQGRGDGLPRRLPLARPHAESGGAGVKPFTVGENGWTLGRAGHYLELGTTVDVGAGPRKVVFVDRTNARLAVRCKDGNTTMREVMSDPSPAWVEYPVARWEDDGRRVVASHVLAWRIRLVPWLGVRVIKAWPRG